MGLKDRIKQKGPSLIRRERVHLPDLGEDVVVRGLMLGDQLRIGNAKGERQGTLALALSLEDPETGTLLFNPNDVHDHELIGASFSEADFVAINEAMDRVKGQGAEGKDPRGSESSPSSSPSASDAASPSLASE